MPVKRLRVVLQTDAIFTARGASVGRPTSLDRLPGAALLGAVAARAYKAFGDDALDVFHLGGVRFGDGRPVHPTHGVAWPTPLSWHEPKRAAEVDDARVIDLSQASRPPGVQLQQLRDGWQVRDGDGWRAWRPAQVASMRTAIDEGGRAREGLLFGFEAVAAGTAYDVELSGDADLLDRAVEALTQEPFRVGRSRSAEFGEAHVVDVVDVPDAAAGDATVQRARVLCLSDLALRDRLTGAPRLTPLPTDVGLPASWSLDLAATFLRTRRYSPFNAHRRRPDLERQVIVAGSVLTFHGPDPVGLAAWRASVAGGVGAHVGTGLGAVAVEPEILAADRVDRVTAGDVVPDADNTPPDDPLVGWLEEKAAAQVAEDKAFLAAEAFARDAARWGVARAQWGRVRSLAVDARGSLDVLTKALTRQVSDGVSGDAWGARGPLLVQTVQGWGRDGLDAPRTLQIAATRVPRHMEAT